MNLLRSLTLLASALLCTALLPAQDFEGTIKMEMKEGKNTMPLQYTLKKDRMRIDMSAEGATMTSLMDLQKKEMIVLMAEQKMYMVIPIQEAAEVAAKANTGTPLEKTSDTERILGYLCTKYVSTEKGTTTEIWAAEGIGAFMSAGNSNPMKPAARNKWEQELAESGAFPLRIVSRNRSGKETMRMEVVAIDKKSVPNSTFDIPSGFQRFDMGGGMMKGLMKGLIPGAK